MAKRILVVNAGSSSLKFKLFDVLAGGLTSSVSGLLERIGDTSASRLIVKGLPSGKEDQKVPIPTHHAGLELAFELLRQKLSPRIADEVGAVGHRIVHGGTFSSSIVLDAASREAVSRAAMFAPLHNPANLMGVDAASAFFRGRPQVAVFDTAFHQTMPPAAFLYALPYKLYEEKGLRRYGFHGTSFKYLLGQAATALRKPVHETNLIIAHLGAGSSMCCVKNGQSVDTSMGMTPLEGLVMGSRCGDIDPGLLPFLSDLGMSVSDVDTMMNKQSGLLGLAGSVDLRPVLEGAAAGNERCQHALEVFTHRIRKYLGAYLLTLGGKADAIVFSAGIGENSAVVRAAVCADLQAFGIELDASANNEATGPVTLISAPSSKVQVFVIATDEELCIAQDTLALTSSAAEAA